MFHNFIRLAAFLSATALSGLGAASAEGLTIETLHSLDRVSGPVANPSGDKVAYVVREANLEENRGDANIFVLDLAEGAQPLQLTDAPESDSEPQWSSDGETIFFLSSRSGLKPGLAPTLKRRPGASGERLPCGSCNIQTRARWRTNCVCRCRLP